eukprot:CAMPEP_0184309730 /NCGR_PEP_ID=MMETSP1049-20130417/18657_1 /TAXON_ID=77928 /ORGANISM="Proteomonas sulcata, Strain CCMP704" /LENGTH=63 /DNA_ID=CAMNT_0026622687 /DNA_START=38 /DNA_END=226 /DNA_ORIENTATION=-
MSTSCGARDLESPRESSMPVLLSTEKLTQCGVTNMHFGHFLELFFTDRARAPENRQKLTFLRP